MLCCSETENEGQDDRNMALAVQAIAKARAECASLGLEPERMAELFLDESILAWMVADWNEKNIRDRLMSAISDDVKKWFARARVATGQCDCVQEVHFDALFELETLRQDGEPFVRPANTAVCVHKHP